MFVWLIASHHPGTANGEMNGVVSALGTGVFVAVSGALAYLAVEPFVRRTTDLDAGFVQAA